LITTQLQQSISRSRKRTSRLTADHRKSLQNSCSKKNFLAVLLGAILLIQQYIFERFWSIKPQSKLHIRNAKMRTNQRTNLGNKAVQGVVEQHS